LDFRRWWTIISCKFLFCETRSRYQVCGGHNNGCKRQYKGRKGNIWGGEKRACVTKMGKINAIEVLRTNNGWVEQPHPTREETVWYYSNQFTSLYCSWPKLDGLTFPMVSEANSSFFFENDICTTRAGPLNLNALNKSWNGAPKQN